MRAEPVFVVTQTTAGLVRGRWRDLGTGRQSAAYLGVPYAAAPVGELRYQAPAPHPRWDGVRDALAPGPTPLRGRSGDTLIPEPTFPGDGTLNLNVFTPAPNDRDAKLPVLVWIHGGAYTSGSPSSPWYDGHAFNRDGVVTVSISYRLAFDGFGWIADAPSNRGVRDWLAALAWVQENITEFGGDPDAVTIAGQSAGGDAVLTLLGMARAQHLFRAVAAFSPALTDIPLSRARAIGERVAQDAGVSPDIAGLRTPSETEVRKASQKQSIASPRYLLMNGLVFGPVVDGDLIERPTVESFALGVGADKPLLLSTADDEFTMVLTPFTKKLRFLPRSIALAFVGLRGRRRRAWLRARGRELRGTARALGRYTTDHVFRVGALHALRARQGATWAARFSHRTPVFGYAVHCSDVPYLFDCLGSPIGIQKLLGAAPPQSLADSMHGTLAAFVRGVDPDWRTWNERPGEARIWDVPVGLDDNAYADVAPLIDIR